jgi:hypothetical protein
MKRIGIRCMTLAVALGALAGCAFSESKPGANPEAAGEAAVAAEAEPAAPGAADLAFLLSMSFEEAKELSGDSLDLGFFGRVAAEKIEVLKTDRDGRPRKVRAVGKVFLEHGAGEPARVLCQEALLNGDEAFVRGRPVLQRGGSLLEGLNERTVFYLLGQRVRVIGLHRVTVPETTPLLAPGSLDPLGPAVAPRLPDFRPWAGGPNPLLPALEESAVPAGIRAEMQRAVESESLLQQQRGVWMREPETAPAPWVKPESRE